MIRMTTPSSFSLNDTTRRRWRVEWPMRRKRSSSSLWAGSWNSDACGSAHAVSRLCEPHAMFPKVRAVLALIPLEPHQESVCHCIYKLSHDPTPGREPNDRLATELLGVLAHDLGQAEDLA